MPGIINPTIEPGRVEVAKEATMKLYQYAILWHPTEEQHNKEGKQSKVVVDIQTVLAKDERTALLTAGRMIAAEYLDQLEQIEVVIRPF